ncbi:MAG: hypothetical protein ACE366_31495 [Bradymonadia bacterium]
MRALPAQLLPLCLLTSVGCDGGTSARWQSGDDHITDAQPVTSSRYGLVTLHREAGVEGITLSAQIIEYAGLTEAEALHTVLPAERAWLIEDLDAAEAQCTPLHTDAPTFDDLDSASGGPWIELLDGGPFEIATGIPSDANLEHQGGTFQVSPQPLPAVIPALGGVVYDGSSARISAHPLAVYSIESLSALDAHVGPVSGGVGAADPIRIEAITWAQGGAHVQISGPGRATLIFSREEEGQPAGVRCTLPHGGRHLIPTEAIGDGALKVTAARVQQGTLDIDGVPRADLMFISSDVAYLAPRNATD